MSCPDRQQLMRQFTTAFDEFSATVRELRANGAPAHDAATLQQRSAEAQKVCERLWAQLQDHQTKHRCWPEL